MSVDRYRMAPEQAVDLGAIDPRETAAFPGLDKAASRQVLSGLRGELADLQRLLWADGGHAVLVVLQAMDTGGKDGTIRKVFSGVNPQGVDVAGFGVPTALERRHDYLWRIHARAPAAGRIAIHNRSHYEDVLVVRVEGLAPQERWSRRYRHIRDYERMLVDEGTTVVKLFLHISKEEQRERLEARLEDPTKRWKFNPEDLGARERWDDYMAAYQDAIFQTTTEDAPWYVVPADRKWYRNVVVAQILVDTLRGLDLRYPKPADLGTVVIN